jgi:hypothetical protein
MGSVGGEPLVDLPGRIRLEAVLNRIQGEKTTWIRRPLVRVLVSQSYGSGSGTTTLIEQVRQGRHQRCAVVLWRQQLLSSRGLAKICGPTRLLSLAPDAMRVLVLEGFTLGAHLRWVRECEPIESRDRGFWIAIDSYFWGLYAAKHVGFSNSKNFTCNTCAEELPSERQGNGEFCSCSTSCCKDCMKASIEARPDGDCQYKCGEPVFRHDMIKVGIKRELVDELIEKVGRQRLAALQTWHSCKSKECCGGVHVPAVRRESALACGLCSDLILIKNIEYGDRAMAAMLVAGLGGRGRWAADEGCVYRECYHCGVPTVKDKGCDHIECVACKKRWSFCGGVGTFQYDFSTAGYAQHYVPNKGLLVDIGFYCGLRVGHTGFDSVEQLIGQKRGMSPESWLAKCLGEVAVSASIPTTVVLEEI